MSKRENDELEIDDEPESTYIPLKERKKRLVNILNKPI